MIKKNKNQDFVKQLVAQNGLLRNQIAALSGLSGTYIRDLEKGTFTSIGRGKLIALGVALSLNLTIIDQLLHAYDRTALTVDDIPTFLKVAEKSKLSSAPIPIRDFFTMELLISPQEEIPGRHVVISIRPTDILKVEGHRSHTERHFVTQHTVYGELIETIGRTRQQNIKTILADHDLDQYVCKRCLVEYLANCEDPVERSWRVKHVDNLVFYLERYKRCNLYLIETCPAFTLFLKNPPSTSNIPERLVMLYLPIHQWEGIRSGQIAGFMTLNRGLIKTFKQELRTLENRVDQKLLDRTRLIAYLKDLTAKFRVND